VALLVYQLLHPPDLVKRVMNVVRNHRFLL